MLLSILWKVLRAACRQLASVSGSIENLILGPSHPSVIVGQTTTTTTVVFFLGGCTYTEIAALRWVARQNTGE